MCGLLILSTNHAGLLSGYSLNEIHRSYGSVISVRRRSDKITYVCIHVILQKETDRNVANSATPYVGPSCRAVEDMSANELVPQRVSLMMSDGMKYRPLIRSHPQKPAIYLRCCTPLDHRRGVMCRPLTSCVNEVSVSTCLAQLHFSASTYQFRTSGSFQYSSFQGFIYDHISGGARLQPSMIRSGIEGLKKIRNEAGCRNCQRRANLLTVSLGWSS